MKQNSGKCPVCGEKVLLQRKECSHVFHLLMTIITGGLWLIVWVLCALSGEWRCVYCGTECKKLY